MKYSKDKKVVFDEKKHIYLLGDKKLQSVTGLIEKFKIPFDSDRIATAYALKNNLKKEDVLAAWRKEAEISKANGTGVHNIFEEYFKTGKLIENTDQFPKEKQAIEFIKDYFETSRLTPIEVEMIVYNNKLASQIDLIAKNKKDEYFIFDWKTNKQISLFSYKDQKMLYPFHRYMDCNFYHYSLQIELYKKLCTEYRIRKGYIVHLDFDKYSIIEAKNIVIPNFILYDIYTKASS